jgi:23S rRNA pseudouridine1911/1915/1917 synthase
MTTDWVVDADEADVRLDKFIAASGRLDSRSRAADALAKGKVFVNDAEVALTNASQPLSTGDCVRVWIDRPGSAVRRGPRRGGDINIVYEDTTIIVVDKPAGLTVPLARRDAAPSALSLLTVALTRRGAHPPLIVHRIDRDTSGLVLFARTPSAQAKLKEQFRQREPERVYWAIVYGRPVPVEGTWRNHLTWNGAALRQEETDEGDPRAAEAVSHYRAVERLSGATLLEVRLVTGKRNQIRIQAALHGHPLVGEQQYLDASATRRPIPFERQALHACRLNIAHPVTGQFICLESQLPADLTGLLTHLR